jgi:hypothetical protein
VIEKLIVGWLINSVIAWLKRWLDQNQPTSRIQKHEKPQPIIKPKRVPKYPGNPAIDPDTGTWRNNK